jgi:Tfp pilus assembly protein PilO
MTRLTHRERLLAIVVGIVLFLLANVVVLRLVIQAHTRLRADIAAKKRELQTLDTLVAERDRWEQRTEWLAATQPVLENADEAGVKLLDSVKAEATKQGVLLENPALGASTKTTNYFSVPVSVETKSSWSSLIAFLYGMQGPDRFIVFENANLQVDPSDQTQLRGRFRIARWYAPQL